MDKDTWESLQIENYLHHKNLHAFWTFTGEKAYLSGVDATLVKEPYWHYQVALERQGRNEGERLGSRPPGRRPDVFGCQKFPFAAGDGTMLGNINLLDGLGERESQRPRNSSPGPRSRPPTSTT